VFTFVFLVQLLVVQCMWRSEVWPNKLIVVACSYQQWQWRIEMGNNPLAVIVTNFTTLILLVVVSIPAEIYSRSNEKCTRNDTRNPIL
jgi:hypothetical protein